MKREFLQNLQVGERPLSKEIIDAIMTENGRDIETAKQVGAAWEEKYNRAVAAHRQELEQMRLDAALEQAVIRAGGRNTKAICALMDLDSIRQRENLNQAIDQAIQTLQTTDSYLFCVPQAPPYAQGTGSYAPDPRPTSLAGAIRERMENRH